MLHVFIDTNILLGFFDYSKSQLVELNKLVEFEREKSIKLYLTSQVKDEFRRRREEIITRVLKKFHEQGTGGSLPYLCRSSDELEKKFLSAVEDLKKAKADLETDVNRRIHANKLIADTVVRRLFEAATEVLIGDEILYAARKRMFLGNPPGKLGSSGDAINWEILLKEVPDDADLYLVSDDGDFQSSTNRQEFNAFLKYEWEEKKDSKVHYFNTIEAFCKSEFPNIKLPEQVAKANAIKLLVQSRTFTETRGKLFNLAKFGVFTEMEAREIATAAVSNNQIHILSDDISIRDRLNEILKPHFNSFNIVLLRQLFIKYYRPRDNFDDHMDIVLDSQYTGLAMNAKSLEELVAIDEENLRIEAATQVLQDNEANLAEHREYWEKEDAELEAANAELREQWDKEDAEFDPS